MKNAFQLMLTLAMTLLAAAGQNMYAQDKEIIFSNNLNAYDNNARPYDSPIRFFEPKINEIILNPDNSFEFWSRPNVSCFTWHSYTGTWRKHKDTLLFTDNYQIEEQGTKVVYKKVSIQAFLIRFTTDKKSVLTNKCIAVGYEYDYDAHLGSTEKKFDLDSSNSIIIPFNDIPNLDKLAAIRIEYLLNHTEERFSYLTENNFVNIKRGDIPNLINVEFVENPRTETVYRTIKAIEKKGTLTIISSSKTKSVLPDYSRAIEFETSYSLEK